MGTLFEVSTLDGWADVMNYAMDIKGHHQQPVTNHSWYTTLSFPYSLSHPRTQSSGRSVP